MNQKSFFKMVVVMFMFTLCSFTFKTGIGVNGDVMRSSADSEIQRITLIGDNGMVYVFKGCNDINCIHDIRHVAAGCYDAIIETNTGIETGFDCKE